ncbi:MAG: hypothetical protein DRP58_05190 [Spirochaetes bacterium]|nr:MAG: hypothetical protein DRP58_05190 [Spirochaetota bacterium]
MLHDPSHKPELIDESEIVLKQNEKNVLRELGEKIAEISSDPVNKTRAGLWKNLNDLKSDRPMVWINEIPWHEMNYDNELTLKTEHPWARDLETKLRREIYQWNHMPGDMIVNDYIECPLVIHSTDFGIVEDVDIAVTDSENDVVSRHYKIQIKDMDDLEKIQMPKLTHLEKATKHHFETMNDIFSGTIPVKKVGQSHIWFTPWDYLIRWWGVQEAMMDLVLRPDMVHAFVDRMTDAWMAELDQFVDGNFLSLDNNNTRIGSGGYGYVSDLPGEDFDPDYIKPHNMWGCSNAQIFSDVSPEMQWDFAIEHSQRWLKRWGHTYYGCCEPLHNKVHLLRRIPNLRKLSVSPWCDTEKIISEVGDDYVMSRKPNPAVFIESNWSTEQSEKNLRDFLDKTEGNCHVELIMKDISTVSHEPKRLWEWETMASRIAEEYSK